MSAATSPDGVMQRRMQGQDGPRQPSTSGSPDPSGLGPVQLDLTAAMEAARITERIAEHPELLQPKLKLTLKLKPATPVPRLPSHQSGQPYQQHRQLSMPGASPPSPGQPAQMRPVISQAGIEMGQVGGTAMGKTQSFSPGVAPQMPQDQHSGPERRLAPSPEQPPILAPDLDSKLANIRQKLKNTKNFQEHNAVLQELSNTPQLTAKFIQLNMQPRPSPQQPPVSAPVDPAPKLASVLRKLKYAKNVDEHNALLQQLSNNPQLTAKFIQLKNRRSNLQQQQQPMHLLTMQAGPSPQQPPISSPLDPKLTNVLRKLKYAKNVDEHNALLQQLSNHPQLTAKFIQLKNQQQQRSTPPQTLQAVPSGVVPSTAPWSAPRPPPLHSQQQPGDQPQPNQHDQPPPEPRMPFLNQQFQQP